MADLRPVTLITGASSGIGAALAEVFAEKGNDLVLVARRAAQLNALADTIASRGRKRPLVITADLTRADAPEQIARTLLGHDLEPEIVVNSAGFGLLGSAASLGRAEQLAMVDLHARTLTDLSLRWVDSLARHRGGILNVASVLGFLPGVEMAVYHATKAYVISFSEALHQELKPLGIRVTVLCPGPVDTEFGVRATGFLSRGSTRPLEHVVRHGVNGFLQGRRVVIPGRHSRVLAFLSRLLPRAVVLRIISRSRREAHASAARQENRRS